jgi:hypothetical protein
MRSPEEILALFEARMAELGMSQSQLEARAFGKAGNTAIQNLKKGASPAFDRVADMARVLGLELYLGRPRGPGMSEPPSDTDFRTTNLGKAGYVTIPWFEPKIGKGSAPVAIQGSWLSRNALDPEFLSAIEPEVSLVADIEPQGLVAIIEARAPRRGSGPLWCFIDKGRSTLARVAWLEGQFVIMPPQFDMAPMVFKNNDPNSPRPVGRVAGLLIILGR